MSYPYRAKWGTLLPTTRVAAGSIIQTRPVTIGDDRIKTFAFQTSRVGSWYIDIDPYAGTFYKYAQGTTPPGTVKAVSFTETFHRAKARWRPGARGSVNVTYIAHSEVGAV